MLYSDQNLHICKKQKFKNNIFDIILQFLFAIIKNAVSYLKLKLH